MPFSPCGGTVYATFSNHLKQVTPKSAHLCRRQAPVLFFRNQTPFGADHTMTFPPQCYAARLATLAAPSRFPHGFRRRRNPADCLRSVGKTYLLITPSLAGRLRTRDLAIADPLTCMLGVWMPPHTHMLPFDSLPTTLVQGGAES
jgi:hypothetical protein